MDRHQQRKAATHQRLIDAARDVIIAKGYDNTEILDISERANVSKATFYTHFPNKEECVRELMLQGFEALVAQIFTHRESATSRRAWALDSFTEVFQWAAANRDLLLIMVGGAASSRLNAFGRQYMVTISQRMLAEYAYPNEDGRYPTAIMAQVVTGLVTQFLGWWLETNPDYSARQMAELTYEILQNGLGPMPE